MEVKSLNRLTCKGLLEQQVGKRSISALNIGCLVIEEILVQQEELFSCTNTAGITEYVTFLSKGCKSIHNNTSQVVERGMYSFWE